LSKHVDENWVNEISQDNDTAEHNEDERETVNNEDSDHFSESQGHYGFHSFPVVD
jgi:hypothetical protein